MVKKLKIHFNSRPTLRYYLIICQHIIIRMLQLERLRKCQVLLIINDFRVFISNKLCSV